MKRTALLCSLALCAAFALPLLGCGAAAEEGEKPAAIENGHALFFAFTAEEEKVASTSSRTMLDYMNALKDEGFLSFEGSDSQYGFFISSVFGVEGKAVSSTAHSYSGWDWSVYTTMAVKEGVIYAGEQKRTLDGVEFFKSSYGVSGLPCVAGESYALVYEFSSMSW